MKIGLLILLLLVVAFVLWRKAASRRSPPPAARRALPDSSWHCVSIETGINACREAERLRDTRFLPREAPGLPLQGCDEPRCGCRYIHHTDRRADDRRDTFSHFDGFKPTPDSENKRRGRDRRRGG